MSPTTAPRRVTFVVLCLMGAALACARAELPIVPVDVDQVTPSGFQPATDLPATGLPAATSTEAVAPTGTPPSTESGPPTVAATTTSVAPPPTATPPPAALPTATDTPPPTPPPALDEIPANAHFTQQFTVSAEGDTPVGVPADLRDGRDITWASLRNGRAAWLFDLSQSENVAGLRLLAHRDADDDTTLLGIDVSQDGVAWTTVYTATGACGEVADCEVVPQRTLVDYAFGPVDARYVRLRGGPTRFAIAELQIALMP